MKKLLTILSLLAIASQAQSAEPAFTEAEKRSQAIEYARRVIAMNVPVHLFGRVVDESGQPLAGVVVRLRVFSMNERLLDLAASGRPDPSFKEQLREESEVRSDSNGKFSLQRDKATSIAVLSIQKEGYVLAETPLSSFSFDQRGARDDRHKSSIDAPAIYVMLKAGAADQLKLETHKVWLNHTNRTFFCPAFPGQRQSPGFGFAFTNLGRLKPGERGWKWGLGIKTVGVEVVETKERTVAAAPADGYQKEYSYISLEPNQPKWEAGFRNRIFYFHLPEKHLYGSLTVTLDPSHEPNKGLLIISTRLNPAGSPNLRTPANLPQ